MNNLLFDEPPIVVSPTLAKMLGSLDEAAILQQIHYWTQKNTNIRDGYSWVYNTISEWQKQFSWIESDKTMRTKLKSLESKGLLVTGNYNKAKFDRTKWYRIDYDAFSQMVTAFGKSYRTNRQELPNATGKNYPTYTIDYTETTTDIDIMSETQNVSDDISKSMDKKERYARDSNEYRCALKLHEEILKNRPKFKKPDLQKWADTFRLMHERDDREWSEIDEMILYATQDDFWKANILSPTKLRKQFDLLAAQKEWKNKSKNNNYTKAKPTIERDLSNKHYGTDEELEAEFFGEA